IDAPARTLEIYYTNPVLVRAGEAVTMPVQVVCATVDGRACGATVTFGVRVTPASGWELISAQAVPDLRFDLTGPALRAIAASADFGTVEFFIEARDGSGAVSELPPSGRAHPLAFFVARRMPVIRIPPVMFGQVRSGTQVLFLPWG